ncbi:helix-turn-helix domain-containing protein [Halorarius litoreus]|uniref:helix-turn-helix domain-containing protein n=1 Tax=Halorarius litoreus TaxID=2962676 RepID=UPI0020CD3073|nr:helix-turn-helix domain-containing protein [Halorarius litoreus]
MPQAELQVTLPEGTWVGDVSRAYEGAVFEVLATVPAQDRGVGLIEIQASALESVLDAVRAHDTILTVDEQAVTDRRALIRCETDRPLLLLSSGSAGVPIELPIRISNGEATLSVTAPRDRLSALSEQLESFGMSYELTYIRATSDPTGLLTDRQHAMVARAAELGYYSVPRDCTLSELAADLGIAKSTASEVLARAESKVVGRYLEDAATLPADD